jgi:MFS family permease
MRQRLRGSSGPYVVVSAIHSSAQSQYAFVLPWMVVARGGAAAGAVLSAALGYLPYVLLSPVAAVLGDHVRPRRLLVGALTFAALCAAAYPLAVLLGWSPSFVVIYVAAVAFGVGRPFVDAGTFRAIAALEERDVLRRQSVRSTLSQAGGFGGPAIGLLLFRLTGTDGVCWGICSLLLVGAAVTALAPANESGPAGDRLLVAARSGLSSARRTPTLRRITGGLVGWNFVAGAAFSLVPLLLARERLSSSGAAFTFLAGGIGVLCLTFPLVRLGLLRLRVSGLFACAVAFEGAAFLAFSRAEAPWLFLLYAGFLVWNSVAASAGNGARALSTGPQAQALLGVATTAATTLAYFAGVLLTAAAVAVLPVYTVSLIVAVLLLAVGLAFSLVQRRPVCVAT